MGNRFPSFALRYSKTAGSRYYANTCPKCGVISGDFYLHSEPGAPFFPTTEEEAKQLTLEAIPLAESIRVRAGVGVGAGDLILEHARKLTTAQPAATGVTGAVAVKADLWPEWLFRLRRFWNAGSCERK